MARHAVKSLRPSDRISKNAAYWAAVASNFLDPDPMRQICWQFLSVNRKDPNISKRLGELLVNLLLHAEQYRVRLTFESMDNYIHRMGQEPTRFAFGIFSMSYAHWVLKVEVEKKNDDAEVSTWLTNMFNAIGLYAARQGLDPVVDCIQPVLRSVQK